MTIFHLFYVLSTLNTAMDNGTGQEITVEDITRHIAQGTLVSYLEVRLGPAAKFTLFEICPSYERAFIAKLQELMPMFQGRFESKLGVKRSGLCLLNALIIQIIQDHELKKVRYNPCMAEGIIPLKQSLRKLQAF
jgi:hypothetical protein